MVGERKTSCEVESNRKRCGTQCMMTNITYGVLGFALGFIIAIYTGQSTYMTKLQTKVANLKNRLRGLEKGAVHKKDTKATEVKVDKSIRLEASKLDVPVKTDAISKDKSSDNKSKSEKDIMGSVVDETMAGGMLSVGSAPATNTSTAAIQPVVTHSTGADLAHSGTVGPDKATSDKTAPASHSTASDKLVISGTTAEPASSVKPATGSIEAAKPVPVTAPVANPAK